MKKGMGSIAENTLPNPEEQVSLPGCRGRVLARDILSDTDWPPFDVRPGLGKAVTLGEGCYD